MLLVIHALVAGRRSSSKKLSTPAPDNFFRLLRAAAKAKASHDFWGIICHRGEGKKSVLQVELFYLLHGLRSRICLRKTVQRFVQKILHGWFMIELVDIGSMPLIARSIEIWDMSEGDGFARQQCGHSSVRAFLGDPQAVNNRDCGDCGDD